MSQTDRGVLLEVLADHSQRVQESMQEGDNQGVGKKVKSFLKPLRERKAAREPPKPLKVGRVLRVIRLVRAGCSAIPETSRLGCTDLHSTAVSGRSSDLI